jgi:hypothetical protein
MDAEAKEHLRHELIEALAVRHPAAITWQAARRAVMKEFDFDLTEEDMVAALQFLIGLGCAEKTVDDFGGTGYWRATSAGVLAYERGIK